MALLFVRGAHRQRVDPLLRWALGVLACACLAAASGPGLQHSRAELPPLPAVPESARGETAIDGNEPRVEGRLLVHPADIASGADEIRVGVLLDLDPGWHVYWRNSGDSGYPTTIAWTVTDGSVGPLVWPAPEVFQEADGFLRTYGYSGQVMLTSVARVTGEATGERWLRADVDLLACDVGCVPGSLELARPISDPLSIAQDAAESERWFAHTAAAVPVAAETLALEVEPIRVDRSPEGWTAELALSSCRGAPSDSCRRFAPVDGAWAFVPGPGTAVTVDAEEPLADIADANAFRVRLKGTSAGTEIPAVLNGVFSLRDADGKIERVVVDIDLAANVEDAATAGAASAAAGPTSPPIGIVQALLFAFLGGLLLNLMPCVLPVLAIKVVGIAGLAEANPRELRLHGLAYAAGIAVTLWVLAAVVIALRSAGAMVGWGFQFQEPLFLVAVSTILVVFALNLFGVFEINVNTGRLADVGHEATGARRSFFEGLLAVVLATPCSAPFLGTAVGLAFAGSPILIVGVFTAIGAGLSFPYVAVCFVPAWQRWIPRSGGWMLRVRSGLGFALLASVVWLLWIAGRSIGAEAVVGILGFLLCVGFVMWLFGIAQSLGHRQWMRGVAVGLTVLLVGGPMWIRLERVDVSDSAAANVLGEPFDRPGLDARLAEGQAVFVYFTADWCLTCKVNERLVLNDSEVRAALEGMDLAILRADWTRRDDMIREELAGLGKAAVPVYAVYDPRRPLEPNVLPELLTRDLLLDAVVAAVPSATRVAGATQ